MVYGPDGGIPEVDGVWGQALKESKLANQFEFSAKRPN
jgi:hypothetical protein